ncbi:cell wall hydrolase [Sphingomonas sp. J315]|uniref:cell wall hydrolase n=1 Tax=Sphingomonas sp. J315 TaxID=2898433 RepID=UPI0021AD6B96|nr:cell wall hydrolase [Sphingomonas sp. J315]UUY01220.1 cell wall hydrolase [Sphingomonas sp. J315]
MPPSPQDSDSESATYATLAAAVAAQDAVADDAELNCLAIGVYYESKGEPLEGQLAVAEVILNRAKSGRFPASVCGVLTQRGQFSFVRGGRLVQPPAGARAWKTALAVAQVARDDAWDSSVSNALFFHARYVSPGWRRARVGSVGNHIFYR